LFRWWCTNGAIDTAASSGVWNRRQGQGEDVYDWARMAVDDVLGGLEHSLDAVQNLVDVTLEGEVNETLRDIFQQYRVPAGEREAIIRQLVESDQLTMYAVMQAITQVANRHDMNPLHAEHLMRVGGDIPHVANDRCGSCRRILPA